MLSQLGKKSGQKRKREEENEERRNAVRAQRKNARKERQKSVGGRPKKLNERCEERRQPGVR